MESEILVGFAAAKHMKVHDFSEARVEIVDDERGIAIEVGHKVLRR